MMDLPDIIGLIGVFIVVMAYLLIQTPYMRANRPPYLLLNLLGSIAILISLLYHWNLASFIIEIAWSVISVYGLFVYYRTNPQQR